MDLGGRLYDLARLRRTVAILDLLDRFGLVAALRPTRAELVGRCPLPEHAGDRSNRQAFRVHPTKGCWRCFSHCGGGDVVELAARLQGGSYAAAARVLADIERRSTVQQAPLSTPAHRPGPRPLFRPYPRELRLQSDHPFLRLKGILPATARQLEAGWWPLGGFLAGCVAVRLHDRDGRPLGYAGRRLDHSDIARWGKWKLPAGLPKQKLLFNWHRTLPLAGNEPLIVVEGPFDAMRVHQAGFPAVVALLGTQLSASQLALLRRACRQRCILLMMDGDHAGNEAAQRIADLLPPDTVRVARLPLQHGPADLTDELLRAIIDRGLSGPAAAPAGPERGLPRTELASTPPPATGAHRTTPPHPSSPAATSTSCTKPRSSDHGCSQQVSHRPRQDPSA
jgi:hypothetical protein